MSESWDDIEISDLVRKSHEPKREVRNKWINYLASATLIGGVAWGTTIVIDKYIGFALKNTESPETRAPNYVLPRPEKKSNRIYHSQDGFYEFPVIKHPKDFPVTKLSGNGMIILDGSGTFTTYFDSNSNQVMGRDDFSEEVVERLDTLVEKYQGKGAGTAVFY